MLIAGEFYERKGNTKIEEENPPRPNYII